MKRKLLLVVSLIIIATIALTLVACTKSTEDVKLNVVIPDGAPALAIAKMLSLSEYKGYDVSFEIVAGATDIATKVANGSADIAIMPTNIAAKLYSANSVDIKMISANVFGLLYLVGTEDITSINQLRGEKILCTGQGGTPDFVLQYVLSQNGLTSESVDIQYITQGSDAIAALNSGTAKFALLGEPAATMAASKANAKALFDLQTEWEKLTEFSGYPQAGVVVRGKVFSENSAFLKKFVKDMQENITWIEDEANISAVNEALKNYNSKTSFASSAVIKRCNIRYEDALSAQSSIEKYLGIMQAFNVDFVGAGLPNDGFYAKITP